PEQSGTSKLTNQEFIVLRYIQQEGRCTTPDAASLLGVSSRRARTVLSFLVKRDILKKSGNARNTIYIQGEKFPLEL
ncbi:MAG: ATP-binding protein, partial [Lachnospiraceae bacterium]|nr:ATP-binding protein [Lachnospiraceae bacterium]